MTREQLHSTREKMYAKNKGMRRQVLLKVEFAEARVGDSGKYFCLINNVPVPKSVINLAIQGNQIF